MRRICENAFCASSKVASVIVFSMYFVNHLALGVWNVETSVWKT